MSNSKINKNSITPNGIQKDADGYAVFYPMGTNKVEIPKNSPHWPKGNKLIGQFVYDENDKLVGFCDTKAMTTGDNGIVVMSYEYIDTEFDSIEKDSIQIHAPKAVVKKASWTGSDGKIDIPDVEYKYKGCKNVNDIKVKDENYLDNDIVDGKWTELLSDLGDGMNMFRENENITSFTSDLSYLTDGRLMFHKCSNLASFTSDLSSLTDGENMFADCFSITSFECSDLSSLTTSSSMFIRCDKLSTFNSDLSSLTNGHGMFCFCYNLTSFTSSLSSLTHGQYMFDRNKLDAPSVKNIIDTINTIESAPLGIGMGCNNNQTDKDLFAQEVGYPDMTTLLQTLQSKGWTVDAQYNGRPSSNYSLRQPESLPIFVKLVEVVLPVNEEEISPIYEYTSQDNTKFYNLDWFHETTGSTDTYTQFSSLDEAISTFNIKPIEK